MARSPAPLVHPNLIRLGCAVVALLSAAPSPAEAQVRDRDARIPQAGSLWIELSPQFYNWNEQFAENNAGVSDGSREPLFSDYDGSVAARLFPGLDPMLEVVNRDADALGFIPLTGSDLDLGDVDFGSIDVFVRRIPLALQFGIGGFAAIEILAPLVKTEVETGFVYDSTATNVLRAETALADPTAFFSQLDAAQAQLQALVDGGTLSPEDQATAESLLADSDAFQGALDSRISGQQYLFTSGSSAGQQMTGYYGGFEAGFQSFGITLPGFGLPDNATRSDFNAYFERDPVLGQPLGKVTRGWAFSEIEIGARFKLLDTFGWPERPEPQPEVAAAALPVEADTTVVTDPLAAAPPPVDDEDPDSVPAEAARRRTDTPAEAVEATELVPVDLPGVRFRTTVGARYRFPLSDPDKDPYLDPDVFLQQPIGTGQADLQLELFQDVAFGRRFMAVAGVTYGLQLKDELVRRVSPPGQPYGYTSQKTTVSRDMGDFLEIVISPRFSLTEAMSLAVEYTFWNKGNDVYQTTSGGVDASPLNVETSQTRHMLGIGAHYRTTRLFAAGRAGVPIDLAFLWQTAISGSGGQTPALGVVTLSIRLPIQLF
ncbi:MAG: hypothetical protein WBP17_15140 [Gemmatimonadota bacterium]|jgi:hypothetical protein